MSERGTNDALPDAASPDEEAAEEITRGGLSRRRWLTTLATAPLLGAAAAYATSPQARRPRLENCGSLAGMPARERFRLGNLHNVALTTHEGQRVRFYDDLVKNRKVAINFMYVTCDGICLPATRNLVGAQKLLGGRVGRDIFFYSITLKPHEDSVAVLRRYAEIHGVGPGWKFLTGHPQDIEALRVGLGFTFADPEEDAEVSNHLGIARLGIEPAARWGHAPTMSPPEHIVRAMHFEFDSPTLRDVETHVEG